MLKLTLGSLLAALAMFLWGGIYWGALPTVPFATETTQGDDAFAAAMRAAMPKSGTYTVPDLHGDMASLEQKHLKGPIAMIHVHSEGMPPMDGGMMFRGFLHGWASVAVAALLLQMILPVLRSYGSRVSFFTLLGLVIAVFKDGAGAVWWHYGAKWAGAVALYDVVAWLVAGLVLAAFIKPSPAPAATA